MVGATDLTLAAAARTHVRVTPLAFAWGMEVLVGARYFVLLSGLVLLVLARSLLHGSRPSWRIACVAACASVAGHHLKDADAIGLFTSVTLVIVLLITRPAFTARADPARARTAWWVLGAGEAVVLVYGVVGVYELDAQFRTTTTVGQSLVTAVRLLVLLPATGVEPVTRHGVWFLESVRASALLVVLAAMLCGVRSVVARRTTDEAQRYRVEQLLDRWGTTSLAPFHVFGDKQLMLASNGEAFVGYAVVGSTAVVLGDPIGDPRSIDLVVTEFLAMCDTNGWTPAFHQVTPAAVAVLRRFGLRALKIGEEAVIQVQDWSLDAAHNKWLRSALRRVQRAELEVIEIPRPISDEDFAALHAVSDAWLTSGGHRERTFSVGQFDRDVLDRSTVLAVRHRPTGDIAGFVNVLPSYRSDTGNFDMMRRRPGAPNGTMDALIVAMIDRCRQAGMRGLTLGMVPFAGAGAETLVDRSLRLLYEHGEWAFHAQGLYRFKDKWQPQWVPRYLAYRTDTELPRVAAAVVRAGELPHRHGLTGRVHRSISASPFTWAITAVVSWIMTVSALHRDDHSALVMALGVRWHDLTRLQLWRLPTAQVVQAGTGFPITMLAAIAGATAVAEWRLRTLRTAAVFFLADWISTVGVLVGARVLYAFGSSTADRVLHTRDVGSSCSVWGLTAAVAFSLPRRARVPAVAAVTAVLVAQLAWLHSLADTQHIVAAAVGLATVAVIDRVDSQRTA